MGLSIRLENVVHEYGRTEESAPVQALRGVDLEIAPGAFAVLMGPSGSGKSTLLNLLGAVDRPTRGRVVLGNTDIATLGERELTLFRRRSVGFIFQFFHLIPTLTVFENVAFPLRLLGRPERAVRERVERILGEVGLSPRRSHFPNELSGGEMQRAAIGRAVVHEPELILADEPTGNLDSATGETILELIAAVHAATRPTVLMATHSERAASLGDYVIRVLDGTVKSEREPS